MSDALPATQQEQDELLLRYLATHEAPCPVCGYNTHQLTQPRCPECGHALQLRLRTTDGISKSWVATLIVAALDAGVGLFVFLVIWREGRIPTPTNFREVRLFIGIVGFMLLIPTPVLVYFLRPVLMRCPRSVRVGLMTFFALGSFLLLLIFFSGIG